jgi:hypothetical protein
MPHWVFRNVECSFYACHGDAVVVSLNTADSPSIQCTGNTYLRLYDSSGAEVVANDDIGGDNLCSKITYTVAAAGCQTFTVWKGCYSSNPCSGTVGLYGTQATLPPILNNYPALLQN